MNPAIADPPSAPQTTPPCVVETHNLTKVYRTGFWLNQKLVSLKSCSLQVFQGQTFGLLGPNGAGKTTLLKLLLGIARPTFGGGSLLGSPIGTQQVKQRVGYLPENAYYYNTLTGWELLRLTAGLFGLPAAVWQKRIPELLDLVGLARSTAHKKQLRQYSKGMLQRIGMAQALINDPDVIFLDEPMSGLDPLGRYQVREIILSLKAQGKTIFFNSHILTDVEMICDRVALLARGELLCVGTLNELLGNTDVYFVVGKGGDRAALKQQLTDIEFTAEGWQGYWQGNLNDLLTQSQVPDFQITTLHLARPSLEEFFVHQLRERNITTSQ